MSAVRSTVSPRRADALKEEALRAEAERLRRVRESALRPVPMWHGSPSGILVPGRSGIHVGTEEAARQALEARIGVPADGSQWSGSREYGSTKLAGRRTQRELRAVGRNTGTGYNMRAPEWDYYPSHMPRYSTNTPMLPEARPTLSQYAIVGPMTNSPRNPTSDVGANARMAGLLKRNLAKRGYYYINVGEDAGSVSAVVPTAEHLVPLSSLSILRRGVK